MLILKITEIGWG